nr:uncharacterized protein CTRU02_00309 [Colletotrichum truncatum]KAF6801560.1 hypothetical protein CTRU02_00309 [Colletotrichum truncatum]
MNWTEGSLARHAKRRESRSDLTKKQQKYFANIRSGRREASRPDISTISFLQGRPSVPSIPPKTSSAENHSHSSPYFRPQPSQYDNLKKSGLSSNSNGSQRQEHLLTTNPATAQSHPAMNQSGKRHRMGNHSETLESKRRRLLQKKDWAGIDVQKPLSMQFPAHGSQTKHKIWGFCGKRPIGEYLDASRTNGLLESVSRPRFQRHMNAHVGAPSIRIRIGSDNIRFGDSSQHSFGNSHRKYSSEKATSNSSRGPACVKAHRSQEYPHHSMYNRQSPRSQHEMTLSSNWQERHHKASLVSDDSPSTAMLQSPLHDQQTISKHFRRGNQSRRIDKAPSIIHQPVPQRLSQLIIGNRPCVIGSDTFGSTIGEVGHNPLSVVVPSENDKLVWQPMLAAMEGYSNVAKQQSCVGVAVGPRISPGVSQVPRVGSDVPDTNREFIHGPRIDSIQRHTPRELRDLAPNHEQVAKIVQQGPIRNEHLEAFDQADFDSKSSEISISSSPSTQHAKDNPPVLQDLDRAIELSSVHKQEIAAGFNSNTRGFYPQTSIVTGDPDASRKQRSDKKGLNKWVDSQESIPENTPSISDKPSINKSGHANVTEAILGSTEADWMNFIFGDDIDEVREAAFQKANQDAARSLRSSSSVSRDPSQDFEASSMPKDTKVAAIYGASVPQRKDEVGFTTSTPPFDSYLDHMISRNPFPPSYSPDSDLGLLSVLVRAEETDVTQHPRHHNHCVLEMQSPQPRISESTTAQVGSSSFKTASTSESTADVASVSVQPPTSEVDEDLVSPFTFIQPQSFVGRLANSASGLRRPPQPAVEIKKHKKRGRPKKLKKASDGRADIRALPNYDDDPIDGSDD